MSDPNIYNDWVQVNENGFGNSLNRYAWSMCVYQPKNMSKRIFVGTTSVLPKNPVPEIYSSSKPEAGNWKLEFTGDQRGFRKMIVFNDTLYVGTMKDPPFFNWFLFFYTKWGCKLYKYAGVSEHDQKWIPVIDDGFGTKAHSIRSMEIFKDKYSKKERLYIGIANLVRGGQIWQSKNDNPKEQSDWEQINSDGFGKPRQNTGVFSLKVFEHELYAGTCNAFTGCEIWKYNGNKWINLIEHGFNTKNNKAAMNMTIFKNQLYVGTFNPFCGCQIWRYPSNTESGWEKVMSGGFLNPKNVYVWSMNTFKDKGKEYLYAGTYWDIFSHHGAELWRSTTGDIGDWSCVVKNGFEDPCNYGIRNLIKFNNCLYAGTARPPVVPEEIPKQLRYFSKECKPGCEIWKYPK